jgi:hypothetical protein
MEPSITETGLALRVNGSLLAIGRRPRLDELDPPLRGIALSDSPVLLRADTQDGGWIIQRLHGLGRRSAFPCRTCHTAVEAEPLLEAVDPSGEVSSEVAGTWALFNVHWWSCDRQDQLASVLSKLDEGRLHGRLRHIHIPRVIVTVSPEFKQSKLQPELERRLAYFNVTAGRPKGELS